ncbi:hypothetical protein FRB90_004334, partial [Tulasnella sp. 427]
DLTDLSEEYAPGPSKSKKSTVPKTGYKPRNILRPPKTSTYSAWSLYEWIQSGTIELEPEYQRDVVWPDTKQTKLIDSLLRNFYIPPIIFRVIEDEVGYEKRICIDGKQRLTSLQRFVDGLIPHIDADDKKKHWFRDGEGPKRSILPEWLRNAFKQKQLVCIEYYDLDSMWEREIFQRVQLGMPLLPAERMAAHVGPWAIFATTIKQEYLDTHCDMWNYWTLDTSRAKDFQLAAQIIMGLYTLPERCNFATQTLDRWLQRADPPSESVRKQVKTVFDKMVAVGPYNKKKAVAPVEFVMIAMLIHMNPNANTEKLGDLIAQFRAHMKKEHVDLRTNSRVLKNAYDYIEGQLGTSLQTAYARGNKRKAAQDDDDDDEYRGSPVAKLGRAAQTRQGASRTSATTKSIGGSQSKSSTSAKSTPSTPVTAKPSATSSSSKPIATTSAASSSSAHLRPDPRPKDSPMLDGIAKLKQLQAKNAIKPPPSSSGLSSGFGDMSMSRRSSLSTTATAMSTGPPNPVVANPNSFIASNGYRPPAVPDTTPTSSEPPSRDVQGDLMDWFGDPNAQTVTSLSISAYKLEPDALLSVLPASGTPQEIENHVTRVIREAYKEDASDAHMRSCLLIIEYANKALWGLADLVGRECVTCTRDTEPRVFESVIPGSSCLSQSSETSWAKSSPGDGIPTQPRSRPFEMQALRMQVTSLQSNLTLIRDDIRAERVSKRKAEDDLQQERLKVRRIEGEVKRFEDEKRKLEGALDDEKARRTKAEDEVWLLKRAEFKPEPPQPIPSWSG